MSPTDIDRNFITDRCNALPMVEWDRMVEVPPGWAVTYGWITDDERARSDFVVLQFWWSPEPGVSYITSSVEWSETINGIICPTDEHSACQPVQDNLPSLDRMVRR